MHRGSVVHPLRVVGRLGLGSGPCGFGTAVETSAASLNPRRAHRRLRLPPKFGDRVLSALSAGTPGAHPPAKSPEISVQNRFRPLPKLWRERRSLVDRRRDRFEGGEARPRSDPSVAPRRVSNRGRPLCRLAKPRRWRCCPRPIWTSARCESDPELALTLGDRPLADAAELEAVPGESLRFMAVWPSCEGGAPCGGAEPYLAFEPAAS